VIEEGWYDTCLIFKKKRSAMKCEEITIDSVIVKTDGFEPMGMEVSS